MNKGQQFWLEAWRQGLIPFHQNTVNPDLIAYWPKLQLRPKSTVFVPLCGKSLDMLWLIEQSYEVIGIELSEEAVLQFFTEHQLSFQKTIKDNTILYTANKISIWVADIFANNLSSFPLVDAIYDRAALIALPAKLRANYAANCLKWLKPSGALLLKTLAYEQHKMEGPPYSVSTEEVQNLYKSAVIDCLKKDKYSREFNHFGAASSTLLIDEYVWLIKNQPI